MLLPLVARHQEKEPKFKNVVERQQRPVYQDVPPGGGQRVRAHERGKGKLAHREPEHRAAAARSCEIVKIW